MITEVNLFAVIISSGMKRGYWSVFNACSQESEPRSCGCVHLLTSAPPVNASQVTECSSRISPWVRSSRYVRLLSYITLFAAYILFCPAFGRFASRFYEHAAVPFLFNTLLQCNPASAFLFFVGVFAIIIDLMLLSSIIRGEGGVRSWLTATGWNDISLQSYKRCLPAGRIAKVIEMVHP